MHVIISFFSAIMNGHASQNVNSTAAGDQCCFIRERVLFCCNRGLPVMHTSTRASAKRWTGFCFSGCISYVTLKKINSVI